MYLTDVMNLEIMRTAKSLTTMDLLENQPVESVSVMEMPLENFIQKNELVLSTALGCGQELLLKLVEEVFQSGAAALVIATGRHVNMIPERILRFAEENHFPVIEIPWGIRFSYITEAILNELHQWQGSLLEQAEELQKKLLQQFLRGSSLSQAAETIRKAIGLPLIILDHKQNMVGKSRHSKELVNKTHAKNRISPFPCTVQIPIRSSSYIFGYLRFLLPSEDDYDSSILKGENLLLEHALLTTALWFHQDITIKETEARLKGDFVWSLANGEITSWETVQSRANSLYLDVSLPFVCILGVPENLQILFWERKTESRTTYRLWKQQTLLFIEEQMRRVGKDQLKEVLITYQKENFIIYVEVTPGSVQSEVQSFLDQVENNLTRLYPGIQLSWGIGENHAGINTFHESFKDASIALQVGKSQKGPGHRSTCSNTSIYRALLGLSKSSEIREVTHSVIGVLIDHDQHKSLDLQNTLTTYIRHKGNVSRTSRVLNLHRQSLLYRLRRIEALTGRSLENPDDLFLLDLSLKLWTTGWQRDTNQAPKPE